MAYWMLEGESLEGQPPLDFESVEQCLECSLEIELMGIPVREEILWPDSPLSRRENMGMLSRCKGPHTSMWGNNDWNCDPLYIYSFNIDHVTFFDAICSIKQSHVMDYVPSLQEGQDYSNVLSVLNY